MAEETEKPQDETPVDAPAAEDTATAEDQPTANAAEAPAADAAPAEVVPPKERRRRSRAAKAAATPARRATSPQERQAEREAERRRKAVVRSARRKREREKARARRTESPAAEPLAPRREQHPGQQKTRQGVVVSDRASKTIVVRIDVARRHRSYAKVVRTSTTLHAHDEREDAHTGDTVVIRESRPLSRTKHWRLVEVLERAK
jgi:small subunit ribosomal protein S17